MRIGVAATPDVAIPSLDWLKDSEHELVRVITQPDRPYGRGQNLKGSAVSEWAIANAVEICKPTTIEELNRSLAGLDLLLTIGYGRILAKQSLEIPRFGCINLHFSLLPKYRGAAPVQRAIENGDVASGVSVFQLDEGMDTGPVYVAMPFDIDPTSRSSELLSDLSKIGVLAVSKTISDIEKGIKPTHQIGEPSSAKKLSKEEGEIDWHMPSIAIINKIRAFYPAPSAWTVFRGEPLKISRAVNIDARYELNPGQLLVQDALCLIGTGDGNISLISVIPAGKKEMPALDWSRGARFMSQEQCG